MADYPQHIKIRRRIIRKTGGAVELRDGMLNQRHGPGFEGADVALESFVAHEQQANQESDPGEKPHCPDRRRSGMLLRADRALHLRFGHAHANVLPGARYEDASSSELNKKSRTPATGWRSTTARCSAIAAWAASLAPTSSSASTTLRTSASSSAWLPR